jgi:uncharacterized membrane protein YdbT with pleckstrin-like domain
MSSARHGARRHAIVLARPFTKAILLAGVGAATLVQGWRLSPAGAVLVGLGAVVAMRAVWRWERTRIVLAGDQLAVVYGTIRRRTAAARVGALEIEQSLLGRLLGYGTVVAGELEIPFVARPRDLLRHIG